MGLFPVISWFGHPWFSHGVLFSRLYCVFWCQGNKTNGENMFTCTTPAFISSMFREKKQRWEGTQQTNLQSDKSNCMSLRRNLRTPSKESWHLFPFCLNKLSSVLLGLSRYFSNYSRIMVHSGGQPLLWWLQLKSYH